MADEKKLQLKARALPEDIRAWLSSWRITYATKSLSEYLNLQDEKKTVIPRLILRLVTNDLEPQDFASELSIELGITDNAAKAIAKEVEAKLLHPIEEPLRRELSIDVGLMHYGKEVSAGALPRIEESQRVASTFIPPRPLAEETERHIEAPRPSTIIEPPQGAPSPFILHEERETVKPIASAPRQTFSIKIPLKEKKYAPVVPRVTARVEMGEEVENLKKEKSLTASGPLPLEKGEKESKSPTLILPLVKREENLPRPPMGALSAKPLTQENTSPTLILPLVKGEEKRPDFRIRLKPIVGEKNRIENRDSSRRAQNDTPEILPRSASENLASNDGEMGVKKVVNYTRWYTPLD